MREPLTKKKSTFLVCFLAIVVAAGIGCAVFVAEQQVKSNGLETLQQLSSQVNTTSFTPLLTASIRLSSHKLIIATAQGALPADNQEVLGLLVDTNYLLKSSLVYLLDNQGNTVACTPYANGQKTLTGKNYSFRPYFKKPLATGKPFSYIALGVTTGKAGLYHATPIMNDDKVIGVLVVKMSLSTINQALKKCQVPAVLINESGIIIASNHDDWLYHAGFPLAEVARKRIVETQQFGDKPLKSLEINLSENEALIEQQRYLIITQPIGLDGWTLTLLYPATPPPLFFILQYVLLFTGAALLLLWGGFLFVTKRKTLRALQLSEDHYRSIIDHMPVAFFRLDLSQNIVLASPAILKIYGGEDLAEIIGQPIQSFLVQRKNGESFVAKVEATGEVRDYDCLFKRQDGCLTEVLVNASFYFNVAGEKEGIEGIFYDISERKKLESKLNLLNKAVEATANAIVVTDIDGIITWINHSFTQLTGYSAEEVIGVNPGILNSGHHNKDFFKHLWEIILQGNVWHGELQNRRKDGSLYHEEMTITPILDSSGTISNFIAVKSDVTDRRTSEMEREAYLQNEKILTEIARNLLGGAIDKQLFQDVLEKIRLTMNASRAVIFEVVDDPVDDKCLSILYGAYSSEDVHGDFIKYFDHYVYHRESSWHQRMEEGNPYIFQKSRNQQLPRFSQSLLMAPFFNGETWAGLFALDDATIDREWSASEISFVTTVAEMLGSYFTNLSIQENLAYEKEKSDAANQAKSTFLANMSHEIRTPMNAIIGMTHLALETKLTSQQQTYITSVKQAANNLLTIINEILDFSKIEAGKMELENRTFNLQELLDSTIYLVSDKAKEKGVEIKKEFDLPPFELIGDSHKFGQVFLNLCDNAVKYTEQGMVKIATSWQQVKDECRISVVVEDTGIGINPKAQSILFESFTQADASITRKHGGAGLGLAISAKLVNLMGGKLKLEKSSDQGSQFCFALNFGVGNALPTLETKPQVVVPSGSSVEKLLTGMEVLLVEDNEFNQMLATELLKKQNVIVTVAANGQEAIDKVKLKTFDLVLMDILMPVLDGLTATKKIRSLSGSYFQDIPIIAMTANAIIGDREKCLEAGMTGYLTKPFDPVSFFAELTQCNKHNKNKEALSQKAHLTHGGLSVLDTAIGLQRLQGNKEFQLQVLDNFANQFTNIITEMENAWQQDDIKTLLRLVHTLKGAAGSIGGLLVQNNASLFEQLLQKKSQQLDVQAEISTLSDNLKTLLKAINRYLREQKSDEKETLPQQTLKELYTLLSEFSPIIERGKIAHSKKLTDRLTAYSWPESTHIAVDNLKKSLKEYNFKRAKSILDILCGEIAEDIH